MLLVGSGVARFLILNQNYLSVLGGTGEKSKTTLKR